GCAWGSGSAATGDQRRGGGGCGNGSEQPAHVSLSSAELDCARNTDEVGRILGPQSARVCQRPDRFPRLHPAAAAPGAGSRSSAPATGRAVTSTGPPRSLCCHIDGTT